MKEKNTLIIDQRISRQKKEANDKQWYKDKIDSLDKGTIDEIFNSSNGVSDYERMKVNYDLFNNIIDMKDFQYVCKPFGAGQEGFELPARMNNRDILSNKIKVIIGMAMARPFEFKVVATNSEATTRKEEKELNLIKEFVINQVTEPIRKEIEMQLMQEAQGQELTPEQQQQIQAQIEEQVQSMTPKEVKEYMERDHQDPAEVLSQQLLEYLQLKLDLQSKFGLGIKHAAISAKEIYWVGEVNGEPDVRVCNPLRFNYGASPDTDFIEDGEWASYEYRMTPSEIISFFGDELKPSEIDEIYEMVSPNDTVIDLTIDFSELNKSNTPDESNTIRVLHVVWKSLREIKFLKYLDEEGEEQEMIVDESYEIKEELGDIEITSEWIPECYEGYKIGNTIYKKLRPVIGQFKDMDNLYYCPLPYKGAIYDATNSTPVSLMDRGKMWQYYLNIIYYRLEMMMASDKGKKILMNINSIPTSSGIDVEKFQYFFESSPFGWFDPNEEGLGYSDVNTIAKVIDLSLASDMMKYLELAEKVKIECGEAMGVNRQMEAKLAERDAVQNTKQALIQNSYILESLFNLHNRVKRNVLTALLEISKVCYSTKESQKLYYVLDDMSMKLLDIDSELLDNSTYGIFINNDTKTQEIKDTITQLAHAALQNQQIKLSDVLSIIKESSLTVAEDRLKTSEKEQQELIMKQEQEKQQAAKEMQEAQHQMQKEEWQHEKDMVVLKETERRETEIVKAALTGMSFNPDVDKDRDGINDFLEISKHGLNAEVKAKEIDLKREKLEHDKEMDKKGFDIENKKIDIARRKLNQGS